MQNYTIGTEIEKQEAAKRLAEHQRVAGRAFLKQDTLFSCHGRPCVCCIVDPHREWKYQKMSALKEMALASGQLKRFPWEEVVLPPPSTEVVHYTK